MMNKNLVLKVAAYALSIGGMMLSGYVRDKENDALVEKFVIKHLESKKES